MKTSSMSCYKSITNQATQPLGQGASRGFEALLPPKHAPAVCIWVVRGRPRGLTLRRQA